VTTLVLATMCALSVPAAAQPRRGHGEHMEKSRPERGDKADKATEKKTGKVQSFDFNGMDLSGKNRTPQLLYFLERANEELERASLEKRSFIPHMVRSVEEEQL
jgi:hypothetical protein